MRQVVLTAPKQIEFREVAAPEAGNLKSDEVLLRILRIGICGSEIHSYHGQHPATFYPVVQGHEYSAEVVAVGSAVRKVKPGDRVTGRPQLVCGECKSAYRRCTWTASGKKKIVWRCINRIEYAKKYCHNSPSVEESVLQRAVMAAIMETANQNAEVLRTLKLHIGMGLAGEKSEDNSIDLQIRIAEIDAEFKKMLDRVSTDTIEAFDEETATRLMNEKSRLQQQLDSIADAEQRRENAKSRLDDIYTILDQ